MTRALSVTITSLIVAACAHVQLLDPQLRTDWDRTLYYAARNADSGNYLAADKLLDEFVRNHPNTRQAREIAFWKAAYLIDPANAYGSLDGGIVALDGYLVDSTGWYRKEAILLRRTAAVAAGLAAQTRLAPPDTTNVVATKDTVIIVKSRDEQIAALKEQLAKSKDELAKVSAELERIKKRLANPSG
ncbi:MAG TPA: hypothetical protein VF858_08840 [Gemmatimonadaceae bacterium]